VKKVKATLNYLKGHTKRIPKKLYSRNKLPFFTLAFIISALIITVLSVQQQQNLLQEAATLDDCPTTTESDTDSGKTPEERAARQATRAARQGQDGHSVTRVVTNEPKVTIIIRRETVAPTIIIGGGGSASFAEVNKRKNRAKGQFIVKYKKGVSKISVEDKVKKKNGKIKKRNNRLNVDVVQVAQNLEESTYNELKNDPSVAYIEADHIAFLTYSPNDPSFKDQWGFNNTQQSGGTADADIDAPEAWDKTKGSSSVKIAVIDSGVDKSHLELRNKIVAEKNFVDAGGIEDGNGHGTHVAGIIAAATNNGQGVAGTCPECRLMIAKVLDSSGRAGQSYYSDLIEAITWAADNGANVINMSLVGDLDSPALKEAVDYAVGKNVIVVAGAGNCGDNNFGNNFCTRQNQPLYPAAYSNVIAVGATDKSDKRASFSNYGSYVDVAAPGVEILSTARGGGYVKMSGTSMASPVVAGTVGLILSAGISPGQARSALENNADRVSGSGSDWSKGRINAAAAVGSTNNGGPNPTNGSGTVKPTRSSTKNPCKPKDKATRTPDGPTKTPRNNDNGSGRGGFDPRSLGCSIFPKMPFCKDLPKYSGGRPCPDNTNNPTRNGNGSGRNGEENTSNEPGKVTTGRINNDGTSDTRITINGQDYSGGSTTQNGEDINTGGQQGGSHRTDINIDKNGQDQIVDRSGSDGNSRTNTNPGKNNSGDCDNSNNNTRNNDGGNNLDKDTSGRDTGTDRNSGGSGGGGGLLCRFAPWAPICKNNDRSSRITVPSRTVKGAATVNSFLLEENVIYACMAGEKACTPEQKQAADRNKDGKVDRTDYTLLMNELEQASQ
jgi:thermitase